MNHESTSWGGGKGRNRRHAALSVAVLFLLGILSPVPLKASSAGTTGANILTNPIGARAMAMGEAYTAQADDIASLYWNPAGIGLLNQSQASFMYNSSISGMSFQNAAVAFSIENGGIGGSLSYQSFGSIEGYDIHDNPTGQVRAHSTVGTLGAGWFGGPWALGFNAKAVQATLADTGALGMAADLGAIYTHQEPVLDGTLRLGTSLRNLGTGLRFIDQKDSFPLEWRLGAAAVQMANRRLNASLDVGKQIGVPWSLYTGVEYLPAPMLALRAGYVGTSQEGDGLRLGIGLKYHDISFDYAFSAYGDLGLAHRYELVYRFGPVRPLLSPEERAILKRAKLALAQGFYGEATMLFDSLVTLEPRYRPAHKFLVTAMKGYEGQERELAKLDKPYHLNLYGSMDESDPEIKEMMNLLAEPSTQTAERPNPDTYTLAPYIPTSLDPSTQLGPEWLPDQVIGAGDERNP